MPYVDPEKRRANYHKKPREERLAYQRAQYAKHREKRLAAKRAAYDPEAQRERNQRQYYKNQAARIEYALAYRAERLEQLADEARERYHAGGEALRARRRELSKRPEAREKQYAAFRRWAGRNADKVALYYAKNLIAEQTGIPAREITDEIAAAKVGQLKITRWVREQLTTKNTPTPKDSTP